MKIDEAREEFYKIVKAIPNKQKLSIQMGYDGNWLSNFGIRKAKCRLVTMDTALSGIGYRLVFEADGKSMSRAEFIAWLRWKLKQYGNLSELARLNGKNVSYYTGIKSDRWDIDQKVIENVTGALGIDYDVKIVKGQE